MTVTTLAECGVLGAASGVVPYGDAGPVIDGVGEALMGGLSSLDDLGLARSLGDRRDPAQAAQRVIISALQGLSTHPASTTVAVVDSVGRQAATC